MKLIHRCMDLLYPPKCVFCDTLLQSDAQYFCRRWTLGGSGGKCWKRPAFGCLWPNFAPKLYEETQGCVNI